MQYHLDSYHYRALRNPMMQFLFDPLDRRFHSRLLKFFMHTLYALSMCALTVILELCYYVHMVGRQVLHCIDPYTSKSAEALNTPSFDNPSVSRFNSAMLMARTMIFSIGYVFLCLGCGFFLAPTTSAMAILCMAINIVGSPCVLLYHLLIGLRYLYNPNNPSALALSGVKVVYSFEHDGVNCYPAEPQFKDHADAIEFYHEYVSPYAATHLLPVLLQSSTMPPTDGYQPIGA